MFYEDAPDDKYTWEGFQGWALRPPAERPPTPTRPQLAAMSELELAQFELARRTWHAELTVATPDYRKVQAELENHLRANVSAPAPRPAAMINGTSGQLGKSRAAERFAAKFERAIRADSEKAVRLGLAAAPPDKWVPTALCTLSGNSTVTTCSKQILNFFGAPHPARRRVDDSEKKRVDDFIDAIARTMHECGTRLLLVDDIHHLEMRRTSHMAVSQFFKTISQRAPVTCVFVGIAVQDFLNEGEGVHRQHMTQTRGRNTVIDMRPFRLGEPSEEEARARRPEDPAPRDDTEDWRTLLRNIESRLVLCALRPRALSTHWQMLHGRTAGTIGVLKRLVDAVVTDAIQSGLEDITEEALRTKLIPDLTDGSGPGLADAA